MQSRSAARRSRLGQAPLPSTPPLPAQRALPRALPRALRRVLKRALPRALRATTVPAAMTTTTTRQ